MSNVTTLPQPSFAAFLQQPEEVGRPKSILLYATHGTRKTSIAGSIIKTKGFNKALFIDIDNGAEVLMNDPEIASKIKDGALQILQVSSLDPQALIKINSVVEEVTTTDFGYDAVILDTLDVAQDVKEKALKEVYKDSKNTFAIYGELGVWTDEIVRKLHECPHFLSIVTCHSKEQTLESGAHRILPRLSGSSKDAIGGIPSIVAYLEYQADPETGETHLVARVAESDVVISKNRYNLDPFIIDPDMPSLFEMIERSVSHSTEEKAAA